MAEALEPLAKSRVVLDGRALGDLDDHAPRIDEVELAERRIREVVRIHVQEEELTVHQAIAHALQRAQATEAAQLPEKIRFGRHLEHHLGAPQAAAAPARERLVAGDLSGGRRDDGVILDVDLAGAQHVLELRHLPRALALFHALRGVRRLANAAVDQPLESDLRIVVDVCVADVDVEERGDVLAVRLLDAGADVELEAPGELRDVAVRGGGNSLPRHVEEDEVVVVREAHHHPRGTMRVLVEEGAHGGGSRLEHLVELLPAVDLLDLGVAHEVDVQHDELAALLDRAAHPLDHDRQRRQSGERVVEHLLVLDALRAIGRRHGPGRHARQRRADARGDLASRRRLPVPLVGPQLDRATPRRLVRAGDDGRNPASRAHLHDRAQQRGIRAADHHRAHVAERVERRAERRRRARLDAQRRQLALEIAEPGGVEVGQQERLVHAPRGAVDAMPSGTPWPARRCAGPARRGRADRAAS